MQNGRSYKQVAFGQLDLKRYVDPDRFDLGPVTHYFLRDDEEESLFETAAEQLPEMEIDEIFSQAVLCVETGHSSSDSFMIPESLASPTVQTFGAHVNLPAFQAVSIEATPSTCILSPAIGVQGKTVGSLQRQLGSMNSAKLSVACATMVVCLDIIRITRFVQLLLHDCMHEGLMNSLSWKGRGTQV